MFLAENVKGLVSHDKGKTLQTMLDAYESMGYSVQHKVLNSLNYNVPQKRQRVVIIGIRNNIKKREIKPFEFPKPNNNILNIRDALKNVPNSPYTPYSKKKSQILSLVPPGGCWRHLPKKIAKEYMGGSYYLGGGKTGMARRLSWDEPGLTVLCSPSQKQTERCHPDETRPFSVRENARIQCFPDDWEFCGSISQQYKQIGNAVPVKLAEAIGLQIKKYLYNNQ
jgi:DNA (cytosine-5)-methyltransferase 1